MFVFQDSELWDEKAGLRKQEKPVSLCISTNKKIRRLVQCLEALQPHAGFVLPMLTV